MAGEQRHTPYHDLLDNIAGGGCVICRLARRSVGRYLDTVSYESVTDPGVRERLRAARGLCHRHGQQYLDQTRDPLGLAIINRDVVSTVLRALADIRSGQAEAEPGRLSRLWSGRGRKGDIGEGRAAALAAHTECPACEVQSESEQRFAGALGEYLAQPAIHAAYAREGQLCVPHFALALGLARDRETVALLVARETTLLEGIERELGEYVRKSDYRFRNEALGTEKDAPARSLDLLTRSD
ncbi:MAG: DUF6062 family protein [Chloroflexota bacterium]